MLEQFLPYASSGLKGALGAGQLLGGLLTKPKRPNYKPPGAINESVATARRLANATTRPGNDLAVADINKATNNSIGIAKRVSNSASQILGAANTANSQRLNALNRNSALNSQFRQNAQEGLMDSLNNLAGYQDKQFDMNKFQPYMQKAQTKAALISSGLQNIAGAGDDLTSGYYMDKMYGSEAPGAAQQPNAPVDFRNPASRGGLNWRTLQNRYRRI
jgi:hypothetical protein